MQKQRVSLGKMTLWLVGLMAMLTAGWDWGTAPTVEAAEATVRRVMVRVNQGWARFAWQGGQGALQFAVQPVSVDPDLLTQPARLTFTATAALPCDTPVHYTVYDWGQPIFSGTTVITCPSDTLPIKSYTVRGADEYVRNPRYFHGSAAMSGDRRHDLRVETDLAVDSFFWGYVRLDATTTAPRFAAGRRGAIAVTIEAAPPGAWVGVQYSNSGGAQWSDVNGWLAPLAANGQARYWVATTDYGAGLYRWAVYTTAPQAGGQLLAVSDPFNLPRSATEWVWSRISVP